MDSQLEEIVKQIADAVDKRVSRRFDEFDGRFDRFDARLNEFDARFEGFEKRIDARFNDAEARLAEQFAGAEKRLGEQFAGAEQRLGEQFAVAEKRLVEQFAGAEKRLTIQFADAEQRLADGAKAHMEELRGLIQLSAEAYTGSLEAIDRRLDRLEKKVDDGFTKQGKIMREHSIQLKALTRQQPRRRSPRR